MFDATEDCRQQRFGEQVVLAINRSDYMLDEPSSTLLQVGFLILAKRGPIWPEASYHLLEKL